MRTLIPAFVSRALLATVLAGSALLAACGGGGGDPAPQSGPVEPPVQPEPAAVLTDFIGTWKTACNIMQDGNSWTAQYVFTAIDDITASYTYRLELFGNAGCTGTHTAHAAFGGQVQWLGQTQQVPGGAASKVTVTTQTVETSGGVSLGGNGLTTQPIQQIFAISDGRVLREGDPDTADASGFPTALLPAIKYDKK